MKVESAEIVSNPMVNLLNIRFDSGKTVTYNNGMFTHSIHNVDNMTEDELIHLCILLWFCGVAELEEIPEFIESSASDK